ncbi:glycosyltransferase family 2 protein [Limosilactobacillus fermentum]|uniref:Glycosyltransferase n=1 Tax=Limosilactobacillus fermentum (strain NBRC 3956 / LMG 18251) TaxID=334390 RepID=A0ABF7R3V5_LIMF3|nr:glycosyltransferase family 2 protein [Limosilactobacillus fermentum]ADJ41471.1 Glycosyltransferase [Limosilactobacillus fermentum CECT 5716]EQC59471.1 glycosyl transferase [Limosilactobacillus fermentum MTCC 8711]BAG27741.1 glycosyltransferase [Limosilactobacillus fermentum IFO 3956]GEA96556.1 glycosyl transferase [Limosilactobacillus fermentum]
MDNLAILIPCYNEEKTIRKVILDCKNVTQGIPNTNIYVYDNNSTDRTVEFATEEGAIVRHEYVQGKGNVIRRMFREVDARCYIMLDGDDTYPAEEIPEMLNYIQNQGYDMVVGDRLSSSYFEENKRPFHGIGNKMVRRSINTFFKTDIQDIMTGYRAFSYQFVKSYPVLSKGFEIETEMSIFVTVENLAVKNHIIEYRDRPLGSTSKLNTFSDGFKVLGLIFTLYRNYRPFRFFGYLSLALVLLAALFFIPYVWIPFRTTGQVSHFPTLIVCGFCVLAGIISFYSGLVLDALQRKERREFEMRLINANNKLKQLK